ncbi:hypothetical protein GCM10008931_43060 [Oceanobacillus oncorhynchi subsp. oncorhynchi]
MSKYKNVTADDLFFCYSKRLSRFIHGKHGIKPITTAKSPSSGIIFSIYPKSESLQVAINDYKNRKN